MRGTPIPMQGPRNQEVRYAFDQDLRQDVGAGAAARRFALCLRADRGGRRRKLRRGNEQRSFLDT